MESPLNTHTSLMILDLLTPGVEFLAGRDSAVFLPNIFVAKPYTPRRVRP